MTRAFQRGAVVEAGKPYSVTESFVNNWGQQVFIIAGIRNQGTTKMGLMWHGYAATRFAVLDKNPVTEVFAEEEELSILN